jgi:hypothetical protein
VIRKKKISEAQPVKLSKTGDVLDRHGKLITENPRSARYRWIKLDVQSWLNGTTRWSATGIQCAFWLDLLAHSGNGRFPGWVCAGQDAGKMLGYPLQFYQSWRPEQFDVLATFKLFEGQGKIRVYMTRQDEPKLYAIEIVNWSKFQSDLDATAARVRKHRQMKRSGNDYGNGGSNGLKQKRTSLDLELELDQERELEKAAAVERVPVLAKNKQSPAAALIAAAAFSAIGFDKPIGDRKFQTLLAMRYEDRAGVQETATDFLEAVLQECQSRAIGVPPQVYAMKRQLEKEDQAQIQRMTDERGLKGKVN